MNKTLKLLCSLIASAAVLSGCASGEDGFSDVSGKEGTTPAANHISLASSEIPAEVLTADGWAVDHEVTISIVVGDKNNLKVSGQTVHFRTDYGLLSPNSCTLSQGECEISWFSEGSDLAPVDNVAAITAWTWGEEGYLDVDDSNTFNDGDVLLTDTSEPFIDIDHDGIYTGGTDLVIDADNNGIHTTADGLFNGANCTHSTLCSTTLNRVPIFDILHLDMDATTVP